MRWLAVALATVALAAACGGGDDGAAPAPAESDSGFAFAGGDVPAGQPIATRHSCDGDDASPELRWQGAPEGTRALALLVEDPDAGGFTHWLVYGMRPDSTRLPPRIQPVPQVTGPTPLVQGENERGDIGYAGPCPPEGETHTYVFHLLALDAEVDLEPGADRAAFDDAVADHVLAEARLEAPYTRS